jgi:hypothetical protein
MATCPRTKSLYRLTLPKFYELGVWFEGHKPCTCWNHSTSLIQAWDAAFEKVIKEA